MMLKKHGKQNGTIKTFIVSGQVAIRTEATPGGCQTTWASHCKPAQHKCHVDCLFYRSDVSAYQSQLWLSVIWRWLDNGPLPPSDSQSWLWCASVNFKNTENRRGVCKWRLTKTLYRWPVSSSLLFDGYPLSWPQVYRTLNLQQIVHLRIWGYRTWWRWTLPLRWRTAVMSWASVWNADSDGLDSRIRKFSSIKDCQLPFKASSVWPAWCNDFRKTPCIFE